MKKCLLVLLLSLFASVAAAQTQSAPAYPPGIRGDFLRQLDEVEKKMVDLAQAIPAEKFAWRPGDGVRSISEVYVHVAIGNFLMPQFIGIQPPPGIGPELEQSVTEKAKIVPLLQQSFQHVRKAVQSLPDSRLTASASFFGEQTNVGDVLFRMANHQHEHLGQMIAYARVNSIVPPWSATTKQ